MTFHPAAQRRSDPQAGPRTSVMIAAAALAILAMPAPSASAAEAFGALNGSWSGSGSASFASGETEKLRCTARYSGGGNNLSIGLKCASASAQINLTGSLDASGNKVSGDWSENSYGLSGDAHGSTNGGSVRLKISGGANGYLTLNVSGNRHTVALSTQGASLTGVNVSLGRR
jgi:hypothetical protein